MKKWTLFFICSIFAILSCREIEIEDSLPSETVWEVEIDAIKELDTRALNLNGTALNTTWTQGDVVTVKKGSSTLGTLTAQYGGTSTRLKGTLSGSISVNDYLTLCFLTPDYSPQNGTLDYIATNCDYAEATVSVTYASGGSIATNHAVFVNKQAITRFSFTDGTQTLSPTSLTISADSKKLVQRISGGTTTYGSVVVNGSGSEKFVALHNTSGAKDIYTFVATVGGETYVGRKSAKLEDGHFYRTSVTLTKLSYQSVDLGLSVQWAMCNIGAYYPEETGHYYAWGETSTKSSYSDATYDFSLPINAQYNNFACLPAEYDAATAVVNAAANPQPGELWRMPTRAECQELLNQCTWTRTTLNGKTVYQVRSKVNSNTIILPCSGRMYGSAVYYKGDELTIWSSSSSNQQYAYVIHSFNDTNPTYQPQLLERYKSLGFNIRPVHVIPVAVTSVSLSESSMNVILNSSRALTATVLPDDAYNKSVIWSSSNTAVATVDANGVVTGKKKGTATITVTTSDGGKTATCAVTVIAAPSVSGAVDLGLSVLWATSNLKAGTSSPACGNSYMWADPDAADALSELWSNYKWSNGSTNYLTKYCCHATYGYNSFVDNKTQIEASDDAAKKKLGGNWYIPTKEEWEELKNNCEYWTNSNCEMVVRSKINNNTITLPLPDSWTDKDDDTWHRAYYWSATLHEQYDRSAYCVKMDDDDEEIAITSNQRTGKFLIRPVYRY